MKYPLLVVPGGTQHTPQGVTPGITPCINTERACTGWRNEEKQNTASLNKLYFFFFFFFWCLYRRSSAIMSWSSTDVLFWTHWATFCGGVTPMSIFRRCCLQGSNPCRGSPNNKCQRPNHVATSTPNDTNTAIFFYFIYTLHVYACYQPLAKPYHTCGWRVEVPCLDHKLGHLAPTATIGILL